MKYDEDHESPDVIDERGQEGGGSFGGGGGGGVNPFFLFALLRTPYGWVVLLGIGVWYGLTRFGVIGGGDEARPAHGAHGAPYAQSATEAKEEHFVSFVLDDAQTNWTKIFQAEGKTYRHAKLVLFTDRVQTACGGGSAATGPFYCPGDERVYIDLGFFAELSQKLGARGQFAQAYVVAHEIGHHVQKLLGTSDHVKGDSERGAAGNSVRLELQADCFAGIWAHSTQDRKLLESGDIESALNAAAMIGDDRLQKMSRGTVRPESFTHGTSAQRVRWFSAGYQTGKISACDTFGASQL
ncbi:MAG TPA: neutral zinc metallopeptidase [Byssovorax sp.]